MNAGILIPLVYPRTTHPKRRMHGPIWGQGCPHSSKRGVGLHPEVGWANCQSNALSKDKGCMLAHLVQKFTGIGPSLTNYRK